MVDTKIGPLLNPTQGTLSQRSLQACLGWGDVVSENGSMEFKMLCKWETIPFTLWGEGPNPKT